MIRIAVCDDDKTELDAILALVQAFEKEYPQYAFTVKAFREPFTLLGQARANGGFDLYLLDIIMPGITGIDSAKELRQYGDAGEIVFFTTSKEYGVDAFEVDALDYIVKPVKREALFKCLHEACRKLSGRRPPVAIKLVGGELRPVRPSEIVYIESFSHYQQIRLVNGENLKSAMTLTELKEQLTYPNFYAPHRAYIVNLDQITGITAQGISAGGHCIPIPRGTLKTVQQLYLDYLTKK